VGPLESGILWPHAIFFGKIMFTARMLPIFIGDAQRTKDMKEADKSLPINDSGSSASEIGERLAVRMMLASIISYQAATSANENMTGEAITAEMKRIIWTVIEAMDLHVKTAGDDRDPIVIEEEIRQAALEYLEATFAFVKI
jgi:hypothetical protein